MGRMVESGYVASGKAGWTFVYLFRNREGGLIEEGNDQGRV